MTHGLSLVEQGVRPTDVLLSDVYGSFHAQGYTRRRRARHRLHLPHAHAGLVCHPRGVVALRVRPGGERPRFIYTADRVLMNIALRWVDRLSALTLETSTHFALYAAYIACDLAELSAKHELL